MKNNKNILVINVPYIGDSNPFPIPDIKKFKSILPEDYDSAWRLESIQFLKNGYQYHIKKIKL